MICKSATKTIDRTETNHITLVIQPIGNRLIRLFPYCIKIVEMYGGHYGLFYKMNWGRVPHDYNVE